MDKARCQCNSSPIKIISDTLDWHIIPFVLRCSLNHIDRLKLLKLLSATEATAGKTLSTRTITKHVGPFVTEASDLFQCSLSIKKIDKSNLLGSFFFVHLRLLKKFIDFQISMRYSQVLR